MTRSVQITVDRELCIGAGQCVLAAGDVFGQDDDGVVQLRAGVLGSDAWDDVLEAVDNCPVRAIGLATDRGGQPVVG